MNSLFFKSFIFSAMIMLGVSSLSGQTVTNNGIKYELDKTKMTASASYATTDLTDAIIESAVAYEGSEYKVTALAERAFFGCRCLKSVSIPASVETIGTFAFLGCDELNKVEIPSLESWLNIKFADAFSNPVFYAKQLYIDGNVLENLVLPEGLTEVADYVFEGFPIKSVDFPSSVVSVGSHSFYQCEQLEKVVTGSSMTTIGIQAFDGCTGLKSLELSPSVTTINGYAFNDCKNLNKVTVGSGVKTVGTDAFAGCDALAEVEIKDLSSWCKIDFAGESANPLIKAHIITLNGNPLKELNIPDDIKEIKPSTFAGCTTIETISGGKNVVKIGEKAFNECKSIKKVNIEGPVTSIGEYAFESCVQLEECPLPVTLTDLGNYAFYGTSLEEVTLPKGVTKLTNGVFGECEKLKTVKFNEGLTSIDFGCFYGCVSLSEAVLPSSLQKIGKSVFYGCSSLGLVKLGNSLESIATFAFSSCPALKYIFVEAIEPPVTPENAFSSYEASLFVPEAAISVYKADDVWGKFKTIESIESGVRDINKDENVDSYNKVEYYSIDGRRLTSPKPGTPVIRRHGNQTDKIIVR